MRYHAKECDEKLLEYGNILATTFPFQMASSPSAPTLGQEINLLNVGVFKTLTKIKPVGAMQARKQANGAVALFWRYSVGTKSERIPIGFYDPSAAPKSWEPTSRGYSIAAAVRAAEAFSHEHYLHRETGGRPAMLKAKRTLEAEAVALAARVDADTKAAAEHTLEKLLDHYVEHLSKLGRTSYKDARSIFDLHVKQPWPEIAGLAAKEVTGEQIANMMRRVFELGKGRTSNKLRSYMRAAYQTASASRSKATIPVHFKDYGIKHNPAMDTHPDESVNRAKKHPLLEEDLRTYWCHIEKLDGFKGAVLRLHLLTGGQRIEQLVKLRTQDVGADQILLLDGKGRPGKAPRPHPLPLVSAAQKALSACKPMGEYAISTDSGKTHLAATTLSQWAKHAAAEAGGADGIADFQAKRIRSGVETLLAKAGVTQDVRGRLQSHGISGVQARHYDGHDYIPEKLMALEKLYSVLEQRR